MQVSVQDFGTSQVDVLIVIVTEIMETMKL